LPAALQNNAHAEDVAIDAFASLWRGTQKGQFPELAGRDHLWRLLVVITVRKAYRLARTEARERAAHTFGWELDQILDRDPEPGFEVRAAEECQRLMALLGDPRLEAVARGRMDGLTVPEIAAQLGCSPRTVDRKLALIQTLWSDEIDA
jgi:DNA-directed RNA polymerase specialized sigma24 family protein